MAELEAAVRVETETGSVHEFTADFRHYRRAVPAHELRQDSVWLPLVEVEAGRTMPSGIHDIVLGRPLFIFLVGLGVGPFTTRITAAVAVVTVVI
jgi:hypothetical protein